MKTPYILECAQNAQSLTIERTEFISFLEFLEFLEATKFTYSYILDSAGAQSVGYLVHTLLCGWHILLLFLSSQSCPGRSVHLL